MEFIPANRILKFNTDQLECVRKQYNLDKPGDMSGAVDVLEAWVKAQKHFMKKDLPRNYLEKAILASKGSLEQAKLKLDNICSFRTMMPVFFGDNLTNNKFIDLQNHSRVVLPKPTDENYRVYLLKVVGSTYTPSILLNFYRYLVLICEYFMAHDYSSGIIAVIDSNEANIIEIIKALNLTEVRQILEILLEGFAMRVKGIHVVAPSKAIHTLITIVKQFLSAKLAKRIYIHKDMSTVFQFVPIDLFPLDYGGKEKSFLELYDELMTELIGEDFINYIKEMNNAKTDESCRDTDILNKICLGMPGSFRTLNVD